MLAKRKVQFKKTIPSSFIYFVLQIRNAISNKIIAKTTEKKSSIIDYSYQPIG